MFSSAPIDKLIASFESLKDKSKKFMTKQTTAFSDLEIWSQDSNNIAIQDISIKLDQLFKRYNDDFSKEKSSSLSNLADVFKKFKELDKVLKKYKKYEKCLRKQENRMLQRIGKCETRDIGVYTNEYERLKLKRETTELKYCELSQEIDATKSILFKRGMLNYSEVLLRQNRAENVLLTAMKDLLNQIPDVSNEEVDDISMIKYRNKEKTAEICSKAKNKLSYLSASSLGARLESHNRRQEQQRVVITTNEQQITTTSSVESLEEQVEVFSQQQQQSQPQRTSFKRSGVKTRVSCPPKVDHASLYPRLEQIVENAPPLSMLSIPQCPPPTYSDSESNYSLSRTNLSLKRPTPPSVVPSAPIL